MTLGDRGERMILLKEGDHLDHSAIKISRNTLKDKWLDI